MAFYNKLNADYMWGMPVSVSAGGLAMDAARVMCVRKALDGDNAKTLQYAFASGMNSSTLEHSVPEQLFSTPENPAQGISAVKALQLANDQGIPIYTINRSNISTILPQLQVDYDVIQDIQNAVNAGKEVTVSKTNLNFYGWTGVGYIVIDPVTGNGAYLISGGMNGAVIAIYFGALMMILGLFTIAAGGPMAPMGILMLIAGATMFMEGLKTYVSNLTDKEVKYFGCMLPVLIGNFLQIIVTELAGPFAKPLVMKLWGIVTGGSQIADIRSALKCIEELR